MGRTNPIALRLKTLVNWSSNVRHQFLSKYIKHIFQQHLIAEPGIRASTTGIWINVTLLEQQQSVVADSHPYVKKPVLDLKKYGFQHLLKNHDREEATKLYESTFGRKELRVRNLIKGAPIKAEDGSVSIKKHHYYSRLVNDKFPPAENLLDSLGAKSDILEGLQIYKDVPIHLKINVVSNPLQSASILAQYVANELASDVGLPRIHKTLLRNI